MSRSRYSEWPLDRKVYVGGLPERVDRRELEDTFERFGRLENVWVARNPPGFAFILFEDDRDAADAVRYLDGTRICGSRARVELSNGQRREKGYSRSDGRSNRDEGRYRDDRVDDRRRSPRDRDFGRDRGAGGRSRSRSRSREKERRARSPEEQPEQRNGVRRSGSRSRSHS